MERQRDLAIELVLSLGVVTSPVTPITELDLGLFFSFFSHCVVVSLHYIHILLLLSIIINYT